MWNDISPAEVKLSDEAIKVLRNVPWAAPLLKPIESNKETRYQNRAVLFEIRIAYALHQAGYTAQYECKGLADATIDFCVATFDYQWRIELVSVFESEAVKTGTEQLGAFQRLVLTDKIDSEKGILDTPMSEAGEMIKAGEKIGEKVFAKGKPTKFPEPSVGIIHVILTDMRGYLGIGKYVIDRHDYVQMAVGASRVPPQYVQWWDNNPIKGLFETNNPTRAAKYIRERIHILAFVCEKEYTETEICSKVFCVPNPHLFSGSPEQAREVLNQCPLRVCGR